MIHEKTILHNVAELIPHEGGLLMQRVPEDVRRRLEEGARGRSLEAANTELRFVPEEPVTVTLSAPDGPLDIREHRGDLLAHRQHMVGRQPTEIVVEPEFCYLPQAAEDPRLRRAFHPSVVRLVAGAARPTSRLVLHGVKGKRRTPGRDELPPKTILTYGTSITQGYNASQPHFSWPAIAARQLGWDVVNLGMAGSCFCERAMADHIAGRDDWDVGVFALSVNMIGHTYDEFRARVSYLLRTVIEHNPGEPIFAITLFPFFRDFGLDLPENPSQMGDAETYRRLLRTIVNELEAPSLRLLEGQELLTDATGLAPDLLHPADDGLLEIGMKVAQAIGTELR